MTGFNVEPYFLNFSDFSIEVCVDKQSSVDFTHRFDHHGLDFVFAVAEIWLHKNGEKHLIVPAIHPENFLERLKDWYAIVSTPPSVLGIEKIISCGGWGAWMAGYWDRIDKESNGADDERQYELLSHLSIIDSKIGNIAIYMYGEQRIFEVAIPLGEHEDHHTLGVWSQFSSDALGNEIAYLKKVIAVDICDAIKRQALEKSEPDPS